MTQGNTQMNAAANAPNRVKMLAEEDSIRENANLGMMIQNVSHPHPLQCAVRNVGISQMIGGLENMSPVTAIVKAKQENSLNAAVNAPNHARRRAEEDSI